MNRLRPALLAYVTAVVACGLALGSYAIWTERGELLTPLVPGLPTILVAAILTVFAVGVALAAVRVSYGARFSVNLAPLFAGVLLLPAGLAGVAGAIGTIDRLPSKEYPWYRFLFNRGMHLLVFTAAGLVFGGLKSEPELGRGGLVADFNVVSAGVLALVLIMAINPALVIVAVTLQTRDRVRVVADQILRGSFLSYVGLAPLGALIAFLIFRGQVEGLGMSVTIVLVLVVYRSLAGRALSLESVIHGSYVAQSRLIDKKDHSTFGHSERVGLLAEAIADKLRLPADLVEQIKIGATLHDIGKIAIPDEILHKTGAFADEEWEIMKSHAQEGYEVLREQEPLARAADIIWSHHENFDGSGYPRGLAQRAVPVGGRITRVCDSYDCITNVRDYRNWVKTPFDALADLDSHSGTWYDPEILGHLVDVLREREGPLAERSLHPAAEAGSNKGFVAALRYAPFLRLWAAIGLSNFGDMLTTTGLALAAYGSAHSTLAVSLVIAVRVVPNLLLGLVAGQIVDRYDRKAVMILMDVARMALVGFLPALVNAPLGVILAIAFLMSMATVIFNPARAAVIPDLVPFELWQAANSAVAVAERGSEILGYAVAAALITLGGVRLVFAIDALTFAVSAGIVLTVSFPLMVLEAKEGSGLGRIRREVVDGLRHIGDSAELRAVFTFSFLMVAAGSAILPLMVPLAIEHLQAGSAGFAICEASIAGGAATGALLSSWLRVSRRGVMMIVGAMGMGTATVFAGLSPTLVVTSAFLAVGGVANMVYLIPMLTSIQELTESSVRGRVMAARFTTVQLGVLVGAAYASVATSKTLPVPGVALAVVGTGVLMLAAGAWAAVASPLRRL